MRGGVSRGRTALLGLDVGTTTVKALLVAPDGEPLGLHVAPYPAERASDQPEEWWEAVLRAVRGLDVASRRVDIAAVGVCGRGSGLALLDRRRDPIPAPWARVRARAAALGLPATRRFRRVAQWGRLLRALAQESPAASAAVVLVLPVKDYIALRLTGVTGTDPAAAGCLAWPPRPERLGVAHALLPQIRPPESRLAALAPGRPEPSGCQPAFPWPWARTTASPPMSGPGCSGPGRGA